jgi:hypothetical protein
MSASLVEHARRSHGRREPKRRLAHFFPASGDGGKAMGRYLLLWLLGIPLPILLLVWLLGGLH